MGGLCRDGHIYYVVLAEQSYRENVGGTEFPICRRGGEDIFIYIQCIKFPKVWGGAGAHLGE